MTKKNKKKPDHGNSAHDHPDPPDHCKFDARSVYPVRIEPTREDHDWQGEQRNYWGRQIAVAKWLNRITAMTAIFAALVLFIYYLQWRSMQQSLKVDERAWLNVGLKGEPIAVLGQTPSAVIVFTNTGKTPAIHVAGNYYVEIVQNGEEPHFERQVMHTESQNGFLPPNLTSSDIQVRRLKNLSQSEPDPLTPTEDADLDAGKAWIAVHGSIYYQDIFKTHHWIKFCFWTSHKHGIDYSSRGCTLYNGIDDN